MSEKIEVMAQTIKELNKENEELKKLVSELTLKIAIYEQDDKYEAARKLLEDCATSKAEYQSAIAQAYKARDKYNNVIKELNLLKKKYKTELKNAVLDFY